jgi:glycerol-3-phosphate cytidylyltransferase
MPVQDTGYLFGVFDLLNIEHLDGIEQAAARCDRLVVGVATDDLVERCGGGPAFVPEHERMEIVSALRGVDVVESLHSTDLRAAVEDVGAGVVFAGAGPRDAVQRVLDPGRALAGTGIRVHSLRQGRRTGSAAVRGALEGVQGRTSVA